MKDRGLRVLTKIIIVAISFDLICAVYIFYGTSKSVQGYEKTQITLTEDDKLNYCTNVKTYDQMAEGYTSGCELAAASILLRAYGYNNASIDEFINTPYINFSNTDWTYSYYGNIRGEGWCSSPAIQMAIERFLKDNDSDFIALGALETADELLHNHIQNGQPVIIWFTTDYQEPRWIESLSNTDNMFTPYSNQHAVVWYAADDNLAYISDPIKGKQQIEINNFKQILDDCGHQSVFLQK